MEPNNSNFALDSFKKYFDPHFSGVKAQEGDISVLKVVSYFTVVIPLIMAAVGLIGFIGAKLAGRVKTAENIQDGSPAQKAVDSTKAAGDQVLSSTAPPVGTEMLAADFRKFVLAIYSINSFQGIERDESAIQILYRKLLQQFDSKKISNADFEALKEEIFNKAFALLEDDITGKEEYFKANRIYDAEFASRLCTDESKLLLFLGICCTEKNTKKLKELKTRFYETWKNIFKIGPELTQ